MWSINELFYGPEPALTQYLKPVDVGVVKPNEQVKDKKGKHGHEVHLRVDMCCEACVRKVRRVLTELSGVTSLDISVPTRKVSVSGDVKPEACLRAMAKIRKRASIWTEAEAGGKEAKKKKKSSPDVGN
jgi:copper chaperone CopZ